VVLGVSESLAGLQALRYAVSEARRRDLPVLAVRAWQFVAPWRGYDVDQVRLELAAEAAAATDRAFGTAMGGVPAGVVVEALTVELPPGVALVTNSQHDGDVVVVGAPRRWVWWARSSAVRYCLRHAGCPVITVPPPALARRAPSWALNRAVQLEARRYVQSRWRDPRGPR
jgi:nucleotide-binding universal stress UspA family protein